VVIRVAVARDEGYFGVPVRALLESNPDMHFIGTLPFGNNLPRVASEMWPSVIVIDTEYMVSQVLPVANAVRSANPSCALLLLCDPSKRGMLPPRHRSGPLNFLPKDASAALLADSVRRLAGGERVVSARSRKLFLSGGTVRNYLSAIIAKTGARNRLDAIRIARKDGWLR
jgi:two-component system response regulator DesR